jgi:hypothetical protein
MTRILDAKYEKVDLCSVVQSCQHLTSEQRTELHTLLHKYEYLFDGTLGCWNTRPIDLTLKPGSTPYHAKPYPIPKVHEPTTRKECTRLEKAGVLRKINHSEWAAPTFIIPKKNGTVRFVSDFRELNKRIK